MSEIDRFPSFLGLPGVTKEKITFSINNANFFPRVIQRSDSEESRRKIQVNKTKKFKISRSTVKKIRWSNWRSSEHQEKELNKNVWPMLWTNLWTLWTLRSLWSLWSLWPMWTLCKFFTVLLLLPLHSAFSRTKASLRPMRSLLRTSQLQCRSTGVHAPMSNRLPSAYLWSTVHNGSTAPTTGVPEESHQLHPDRHRQARPAADQGHSWTQTHLPTEDHRGTVRDLQETDCPRAESDLLQPDSAGSQGRLYAATRRRTEGVLHYDGLSTEAPDCAGSARQGVLLHVHGNNVLQQCMLSPNSRTNLPTQKVLMHLQVTHSSINR